MRFLILRTDYPEFLRWLYAQHPGLEREPYQEQMRVRSESFFGEADFYSSNLRSLGHEAQHIHANNESAQKAWNRQHHVRAKEPPPTEEQWHRILRRSKSLAASAPLRGLKPLFRPILRRLDGDQSWFYRILAMQIKHYSPDVLLNQAMDGISARFLREMKPWVRLLVGQHAATDLPRSDDYSCYDLVVSTFPPTVDWFRQRKISAELHRLAFDPRVLASLDCHDTAFPVTFIGSLSGVHTSRIAFLEAMCSQLPQTRIWAPTVQHLPASSPIKGCYMGQAWGRRMYEILASSRVTLNHHGDVAPYANNVRLYQATGVGTLLITDWKEDLHQIFEPGKELVPYRTPDECAELVTHYLEHEEERQSVARAGQKRTLADHTYRQRMQELVEIVSKRL